MIRALAALLVCVPLIAVPARADQTKESGAAAGSQKTDARKGSKKVKQTAVITMEKGGEIVIDFYPEDAPKTVENFVTLARKGFYDGLTFHRVEPGFVVQGGDPDGTGTGGPGYTIKAEFNKRKHVRGTVAMARTQDPDSAGSQFYICFKPAPFLDGQYTVFGIVTKGMDVVDRIKVGDKMKTVKIVEKPMP
jgi:peptidylprolyl isomerase/peptidyl-prolyl cis-trans isomerase B (cyclophilin B)